MPEPLIAFIDIETAPIEGFSWEIYDTSLIHVVKPTYMLCFAVKWSHKKDVETFALCDYPDYAKDRTDDRLLVGDLWKVMDRADIIVAHNGDSFDIKKSNARFIVHGLPPPSPAKTVDTLKIARKHFRFDSNKLDNIGRYLGVGRKLPHTGKDLWLGCMAGDPKSWRVMRRYNAQDVRLLEAVYYKVRSWSSSHPDLRVWTGRTGCPACKSQNIQCRGFNVAKSRKTQRTQCRDCGHWYSGRIIRDENAVAS